MKFSPAKDEIAVKTYSPLLDQYGTDIIMGADTTSQEFTIYYDMVLSPTMDYFNVNFMRVIDTTPNRRDITSISGSLKLPEDGWLFNLDFDNILVTVNDLVITIPAGSFEQKNLRSADYYYFRGEIPYVGRVYMDLNLDKCWWWIYIWSGCRRSRGGRWSSCKAEYRYVRR